MAKDQKIIRAKAGLLDLDKQIGDVGQACKIMGFEPATASTGSKNSTTKALEAKVAQDGLALTESQLAALEKAKSEKEADREFVFERPG